MRTVTVFNTQPVPVALAYSGESVEAGGWAGGVNADASLVAAMLKAGYLIEVTRPDGDQSELDPRAVEAFDATDKALADTSTVPADPPAAKKSAAAPAADKPK